MGGYVSQLSRRNLALVSAGTDFSADRPDRNVAASERLRLQELRADFDYVLIDGVSPVVGDEPIALGKMTEDIVLVLKTHSTRRANAQPRADSGSGSQSTCVLSGLLPNYRLPLHAEKVSSEVKKGPFLRERWGLSAWLP
jgi:hypothetical protein